MSAPGHLAKVLAAMADRGLDVLVLGRQDDADYASGMTRLWTAGTRPFGAGCVVVGATGRVHVLSSWEAGLPEGLPFEDCFGITWNPATMAASMAGIEGLAEASRIGVDASSPSFERAAARFAPGAEIVPADDLMAAVRRIKSPDEIARIRAACAVAWRGVDAAVRHADAQPDADDLALSATLLATVARHGSTIPSSAPLVARQPDADVGVTTVLVDVGVLADHWEGGVGGRFELHADGLHRRDRTGLATACQAGATGSDLAGAAQSDAWCVRGVGMGWEHPVITAELGHGEILEPGMVLSVADGARRDVLAVVAGEGPELLSG